MSRLWKSTREQLALVIPKIEPLPMKSLSQQFVLLVFCATTLMLAGERHSDTRSPTADQIAIALTNTKFWTISELSQAATRFLVDKGSMPQGLNVQTLVRIYPKDKTKMCEFYYTQGFGK